MNLQPIRFDVIDRDGEARAAILQTRRGVIETPVFMPVGTAGSIKGIRFDSNHKQVSMELIRSRRSSIRRSFR